MDDMSTYPRVSVIIVSYNSAARLPRCLASLAGADEIIVVDNASCDGSADVAAELGAKVIESGANIGFGAGCNRGAAIATGDYFLFLNPDASLTNGSLKALRQAALTYPDAAAFGARLEGEGEAARIQFQSYIEAQTRLHAPASAMPRGECCVGFLSGAALMVQRQSFEAVGGFDERIFLYYEDDDLCYRLRRLGRALIFVPEAEVMHARGQSSRRTIGGSYRRAFSMARSRIYICEKYGLPPDTAAHLRKALLRTLRAGLLFNAEKTVRHAAMLGAYALAAIGAFKERHGARATAWLSKNTRKININF